METTNTTAHFTYVDNAESLAQLTQALRGVKRVSLDTEADSLHHYYDKVCLIQLSFGGKQYIIDPLVKLSLDDFFKVLTDKELIAQGADYDLRMLKKTFGFLPKAPVFDTMIAAQVLGIEKFGLAALVEKYCAVVLPKTGQKSDWSRRPLSAGLLNYASDDTKYLEQVADAMTAELQTLNRLDWHRECCERTVASCALPPKAEKKDAWRVKGSSKLGPAALVYVFELWKWREEEAQQKDRPPFMTMLNENLVALAEWLAANPGKPLSAGPSFLRNVSGDKLARLEKAVETAAKTPQSEWPGLPEKKDWTRFQPTERRFDVLLEACRKLAGELKIEPSFFISRSMLTAVFQSNPKSLEEAVKISGLMRWQAELILPLLKPS